MNKKRVRLGALTLATAIALAPARSEAIPPLLLLMVKQIVQQAATSMIKDTLLSSLAGMGCKGIALSNALAAFDLRSAAGGGGGMLGMLGGMPKMAAGMTMPRMPGSMGMPQMPAGPGLAMAKGLPQGIPAEVAATLRAMVTDANTLPADMATDPDQMAMMERMQHAMSQPLTPPETLATIDELFELGFLPKAIQAEFKECMVLVPETIPALGMGMAMLKPMIPQLRQARVELHALSPAEQDEVADALMQEIKELPADQRTALMEHLDSGFFPQRVSASVKAGLAAK